MNNRDMPPMPPGFEIGPAPLPGPVFEAEKPLSALLTDEETEVIVRATLSKKHIEDPQVLTFISSYLACRNKAQAARDAGLTYSSANSLINRHDVHTCITKLTAKMAMKFGYEAAEVVERMKEVAEIDPIEFENPDGSFKTHLSEIKPEARRAIKKFKAKNIFGEDTNGMKIVIGQLIEVELHDKLKANELLGVEKKLFKETKRVEHDVTANMATLLLESQRLADTRAVGGARVVEQIEGDVMEMPESKE